MERSRTRRRRAGTAASRDRTVAAARSRARRGRAGMAGRRCRRRVWMAGSAGSHGHRLRPAVAATKSLEKTVFLGMVGGSLASMATLVCRGYLILVCLLELSGMTAILVRRESLAGMSILACPESSASMAILARRESSAGMATLACLLEPTASAVARRRRGAQWVALPRVDLRVTSRTTVAGNRRMEASRHGMDPTKAALTGWGCCRHRVASKKNPLVETGTTASWSPLAVTSSSRVATSSSRAATRSSLVAMGMTASWSPQAATWSSLAENCRSPSQAETQCHHHQAQAGWTRALPGIAPCCSRTGRPRRRTARAGAALEPRGCSSTCRPPLPPGTRGAR